MLIPPELLFSRWHLIKREENSDEWCEELSEGGRQEKAEQRGQEDALDLKSRDERHPETSPPASFGLLELDLFRADAQKDTSERNKFAWFVPQGQTVLVKVFSLFMASQNNSQKKEKRKEKIVVSGLV